MDAGRSDAGALAPAAAAELPASSAAKRRRLEPPSAPTLGAEEFLSRMRDVVKPMENPVAMYNSLVGGVVKDPPLMSIPLFDHAVVRGHAVFDTCSVVAGRLYRVDVHLDRHVAGAQRGRIPLPFGETAEECKREMRQIIAQTVVASGLRDAGVRFYTSAGPGNFGVAPRGCRPAFYVVVLDQGSLVPDKAKLAGICEYTTDIPLKPQILATTKSNNYMLNVLTAMSSQDRGGTLGILVDGDGFIAESCVMNCTFVTRDRRLVTPPFDNILAGTTVRKVLELAHSLVKEGLLTAVAQEPILAVDAHDSVEMFLTAADCKLLPVVRWDDKPVGSGEVGPVAKRLVELMARDMLEGTADHYDLVYGE